MRSRSGALYADGVQALGALLHLITHFVAFADRFVDPRFVDEHIFSALVRRNEPETLGLVEELDSTRWH